MRAFQAGVALAALLAAACARGAGTAPPGAAPKQAIPVTTAAVVRAAAGEASVPAAVHARERAALSARVSASVVELPYREGDAVARGALLVRLEDGALRAAVAAAEAGVRAAEQELKRAESLLAKNAATPQELEAAQARAAAARAALSGARDSLSYAELRAPFAGRVVARPASLGDVAGAGRTLIEIEGTAGLELRATLDRELLDRVRPGQRLQALVDGQPGPLPAQVRSLVASADPATHRFDVRADLEPAPGLRAGLFARLAVPGPVGEERLLAPSRALFRRGGMVGAFVVTGGSARLRWLAVGASEGEQTEVRAGLEEGERVALDPAPLSDGTAVRED